VGHEEANVQRPTANVQRRNEQRVARIAGGLTNPAAAANTFPIESESTKEGNMPQGDKSSYTSKQKRKAEHIEESYEKRGVSKNEAEKRAWATVNKSDKGGKKSGSGRGKKSSKAPMRKGGKKGGKKAAGKKKR
jgi:plasmid stabilization system protein ParE